MKKIGKRKDFYLYFFCFFPFFLSLCVQNEKQNSGKSTNEKKVSFFNKHFLTFVSRLKKDFFSR